MSFLSNQKEGRSFSPSGESTMTPQIASVLKNTYIATFIGILLMSVTGYIFSDFMLSMGLIGMIDMFLIILGLVIITSSRAENSDGLFWYLLFMAVEGILIGGVVSIYLVNFAEAVIAAALTTAVIFASLSYYIIATKKNLNHWGGFLTVGIIALIVGSLISSLLGSGLGMTVMSGIGAVLFSLFILYDTSRLVSGVETSYVRAALGMSLNIINLFLDLLRIFSVLSGDD
jgi:modulator of FtsH protease